MEDSQWGIGAFPAGEAAIVIMGSAVRDSVIDPKGTLNRRVYSLHNYFWYNGPNYIISDPNQTTSYTWTMQQQVGGDGTWTDLLWEVSNWDGVTWTFAGNGTSYTRAIPAMSSQSFRVRLTATSAGHRTTNDGLGVKVVSPPVCHINCPQ